MLFEEIIVVYSVNHTKPDVRSEAFAATGFNTIFLGDQTRQMNKRNRRFEDHLGLHHQGSDDEEGRWKVS
jgi:hypothetical protein